MPDSTSQQRIIVTGAGGQLGRALQICAYQHSLKLFAYTSQQWDITNQDHAYRIIQPGDTIINCAAYTQVDASESHQDRAYAINALGPECLADICHRRGARLIHISTDYVFDGRFPNTQPRPYRPDDIARPLNIYGASKLAGETAIRTLCPEATIVRTSWVYNGSHNDFITAIRAQLQQSQYIHVVEDQTGSPTYAPDLAQALLQLIRLRVHEPIIHLTGATPLTRYQQACSLLMALGEDPQRIHPVSSSDYPTPAQRPSYSVLENFTSQIITPLRGWKQGLHAALVASNKTAHR